jgi:large subunit ribosomal protein L30
MAETKKMAIILVRGMTGMDQRIKDTVRMLNIGRRNICVIVDKTPSILGMVQKIISYVTFGEIDDATLKLLKEKKGEGQFYRLNSPRKGYGRKGIKQEFSHGGALGYRGDKINDLIRRMI